MSGYTSERGGSFTDTADVNKAVQQGLLRIAAVGNQTYYECQVCNCNMAGSVPAEAHLRGSPHFKALRNFSISSPLTEAVSKLQVSKQSGPSNIDLPTRSSYNSDCNSDETLVQTAMKRGIVVQSSVGGIVNLTCTVCNVTCTGDVPMAQHLKGEPHMKRQRRMGIQQENMSGADARVTQTREDFGVRRSVSPLRSDVGSGTTLGQSSSNIGIFGGSSDTDDSLQKAMREGIVSRETSGGVETLTCEVCSKACTGSIPMKQHLQSSAHIRKLSVRGIREGGPRQSNTASSVSSRSYYVDQQSNFVERESVPVATQTPEPPENSRSETNSDPVVKAVSDGIVIEVDGSLMCLVCQLTCTGKYNMTEHLLGDHHRRKWRDQVEQLQMFGGSDSTIRISTPPRPVPSPQTSPSKNISFESSRSSSSSPGYQDNQSNRVYSNPFRGQSVALPQNLRDLAVYFPDDPLGNL